MPTHDDQNHLHHRRISPFTFAEFALGQDKDSYDVSLIQGYNVGVGVTASGKGCSYVGCTGDMNSKCPAELRVEGRTGRRWRASLHVGRLGPKSTAARGSIQRRRRAGRRDTPRCSRRCAPAHTAMCMMTRPALSVVMLELTTLLHSAHLQPTRASPSCLGFLFFTQDNPSECPLDADGKISKQHLFTWIAPTQHIVIENTRNNLQFQKLKFEVNSNPQ